MEPMELRARSMPNNMVRCIISRISIRIRNSILVTVAGMLFFSISSAQDLALELFREGQWSGCLRECQRIEIEQGENTPPRVQLLGISCSGRMKQLDDETVIRQLELLAAQTNDLETAAIASFETGRLFWSQGNGQKALDCFAVAFQSTTNQTLFLQAACSAFLLMDEDRSLQAGRPDLVQQINTSRDLWSGELFGLCRLKKNYSLFQFNPADWLVRFYRSQISPAIGQRCTLDPSCSEYFYQAVSRHGLLSVPLIADRFIREPGVNNEKKEPVFINGMLRYRDPLDNHDFWLRK